MADRLCLSIIVHNMHNYDSHFITKNLTKEWLDDKKVSTIAYNSEKLLTVQLRQMRILDSIQFLNASLHTIVKTLVADDPTKCEHLKPPFEDENILNMLLF